MGKIANNYIARIIPINRLIKNNTIAQYKNIYNIMISKKDQTYKK